MKNPLMAVVSFKCQQVRVKIERKFRAPAWMPWKASPVRGAAKELGFSSLETGRLRVARQGRGFQVGGRCPRRVHVSEALGQSLPNVL